MKESVLSPGFERVDTVGSKASSAFSIRSSRRSQDTGEYKMSGTVPEKVSWMSGPFPHIPEREARDHHHRGDTAPSTEN